MSNLIAIRIQFNSTLSESKLMSKIKKVSSDIASIKQHDDLFKELDSKLLLLANPESKEKSLYFNFDKPAQMYELYIKTVHELQGGIEFDFDHHVKVFFKHEQPNEMKYLRINDIKFVLGIDEQYIYSKFPMSRKSVFSQHINGIKYIEFNNVNGDENTVENQKFYYKNTKYNLFDLTNKGTNLIVMNFAFGTELYNQKDLITVIDMIDTHIDNMCKDSSLKTEDKKKLSRIYKVNRNIYDALNTYKGFTQRYGNIRLLHDLRDIKPEQYLLIKDKLIEYIILGNINNGIMNYDSSTGKYELKDADLKFPVINEIDLMDCNLLYGDINGIRLYGCKIENSLVNGCMVMDSKAIESILRDTIVDKDSKLTTCFIEGKYSKCSATTKDCKGDVDNIIKEEKFILLTLEEFKNKNTINDFRSIH